MNWRAYFSIGDEEFSYMAIRGGTREEAREKAIQHERAIEGLGEAPVKFLDVFPVVTAADLCEALRPRLGKEGWRVGQAQADPATP